MASPTAGAPAAGKKKKKGLGGGEPQPYSLLPTPQLHYPTRQRPRERLSIFLARVPETTAAGMKAAKSKASDAKNKAAETAAMAKDAVGDRLGGAALAASKVKELKKFADLDLAVFASTAGTPTYHASKLPLLSRSSMRTHASCRCS